MWEEETWDSTLHSAQGHIEEKGRAAGEAQPQESRVQLSIRFWYSSSAGASCLPALVCFQSHLSPVSRIVSAWFGQGLVNRLCCCCLLRGDGRAWCVCWLKAWQGAGWAKQIHTSCLAGEWYYPGLLPCLMSHLICHVPHGRWGLFRIN